MRMRVQAAADCLPVACLVSRELRQQVLLVTNTRWRRVPLYVYASSSGAGLLEHVLEYRIPTDVNKGGAVGVEA